MSLARIAQLIFVIAALTACSNGARGRGPAKKNVSEKVVAPKANYRISSVEFAAPETEGQPDTVTIRLDTTPPFTNLTEFCSIADGSTPCSCYFKWSEVNPNATYTVTIPRYVQTPVDLIQPGLVQCKSPERWNIDVRDDTVVSIGVVPTDSEEVAYNMPSYNMAKKPSTGGFTDAQGRAFDNILHYSCYEQFPKGLTIRNRIATIQPSGGGAAIRATYANDFCLKNVEAGGATATGCEGPDGVDFSAEANYFNLYTRASDRGTINASSFGRYTCPVVEQPLSGNPQATFWPLDTTFALSMSPNSDFPVAVEGFTKLSFGSDPKSQPTTCYTQGGSGGGGTGGDTILTGCLGFASKTKPDGSCGTFRDAAGATKPMFRLRRYITIYPPNFEADGRPYNQGQASDVVYVLDRPVANPTGDVNKPFSMLGPKPCSYAYFDHSKTARTGVAQSYAGTFNRDWKGRNYDGLQFPNMDGDTPESCAALVQIPNSTKTRVSFGTVYANGAISAPGPNVSALTNLFIRPVQPWAPHYEEDFTFTACAPQSTPVKDPPLHFAKLPDGNVAYCAENYPTQNGNVDRLDTIAGTPGSVIPYTSHVSKGSISPVCVGARPQTLPGTYAAGPAKHTDVTPYAQTAALGLEGISTQTCDRTVPGSLDAFYRVPLLAPPIDVENAIKADPSFACTITFDAGGAKKGRLTPTQGCCGPNVRVHTGPAAAPNDAQSAHLEPTGGNTQPSLCQIPAY